MSKSKKSLYILLPVNLLVWGFIIFKIVSSMQSNDLPEVEEKPAIYAQANTEDTLAYKLNLNYEDPFLKQEPTRKIKNGNAGLNPFQNAQLTAAKPKPEKIIKDIKYLGTVQNKTRGLIMAMISINGNSHVVKRGDVVDGVKFQNISQEVIEVRDGGHIYKISTH